MIYKNGYGNRKFEFVWAGVELAEGSHANVMDSYSSIVSNIAEDDKLIFQEKLKVSLDTRQPLNTEFRLRSGCEILNAVVLTCNPLIASNSDGTITYGSIYDIN
ncbi:MAG: hypothetical protein IPO63_10670 [Bacteroidetes bacterium]|nr:hypothetical protein [Bacteroidota bacterium]